MADDGLRRTSRRRRQSSNVISYTESSTSKVSPLPAWARWSLPKALTKSKINSKGSSNTQPPLSLADEECYLRTYTYHQAARLLDLVFAETLQELGEPVLSKVESMLATRHCVEKTCEEAASDHLPHRPEATHPQTTTKETSDEVDDDERLKAYFRCFAQRNTTTNDDTSSSLLLLPVLYLSSPHHVLDTHEWIRWLYEASQKQLSRTCVVWLQDFAEEETTLASLVQELTRQCYQQQPPPAGSKLDSNKQTSNNSCTERLQQWAAQTRDLDNILVYMTTTASSTANTQVQHRFLEWAAEQRMRHGIPLSVVILGPQQRRVPNHHHHPWIQPTYDSLPSASLLLQRFWRRLYVDHAFSVHLPYADLLQPIWTQAFKQQHGSAVVVVQQLKACLAQFVYSHVGSFLLVPTATAATTTPAVADPEDMRRQWFLLDPQARRYLQRHIAAAAADDDKSDERKEATTNGWRQWQNELEQRRRQLAMTLQLEACFWRCRRSSSISSSNSRNGHPLNTMPLLADKNLSVDKLSRETIQEMMSLLFQLRQQELLLSSPSDSSSQPFPTPAAEDIDNVDKSTAVASADERSMPTTTLQFVNEFALVLDQAVYASDLLYSIESVYTGWFGCLAKKLHCYNLLPSHPSTLRLQPSWSIQPRRDTIAGLVEHTDEIHKDNATANIPGILYRLVDSSYSIGQDEWFALFYEHQQATNDMHTAFMWFASGIYALQVMGLIKERKVPSGKTVFDKTVVVWCGSEV